jgi:hypothetical protein
MIIKLDALGLIGRCENLFQINNQILNLIDLYQLLLFILMIVTFILLMILKCNKIKCEPILDALKAVLKLIVDCFKCVYDSLKFCKKKY